MCKSRWIGWLALLTGMRAVVAANGPSSLPPEAPQSVIEMFVGDSRVIPLSVRRAAVGNGKILSVTTPVKGEVLLLGEAPGTTALQLWLADGEHRKLKVVVNELDLGQRIEQVRTLLEGSPHVHARIAGSRIVLEGDGATDEERTRAGHIAESWPGVVLDFVGRVGWEPLIEMDVRILEVREDQLQDLGLKWDESTQGPAVGVALGATPLVSALPPTVSSPGAYFSLAAQLTARINLLQQRGLARVLAEPRLTCRSGSVARFVAGGEIPLPVSDGLGSTDVQYKEYGIILEVRPRADGSGAIYAEISAELSQIDDAVRVQNFPGFLKRQTSTAVNLRAGETLVLAGLVASESARDRRGIPGLSRLPVAGAAFRSRQQHDRQTELVILLRPRTVAQLPEGSSDASADQRQQAEWAPRPALPSVEHRSERR